MSSWVSVPFSGALLERAGGNRKIQKGDYATSGLLAIVDQGASLIGGYTDDVDAAYKYELPVIIFGDHTRKFKYVDFPFALGADGVKVLAPRDGFDARFLYHYLSSLDIPSQGYSRHFKFLKEFQVIKPPFVEQRKIADLLDRVDSLRSSRRTTGELLNELGTSIFFEMFGDPILNPRGWEKKPLPEICYCYSGGTPSTGRAEFWGGYVPWFSPKDLKANDLFDSQDHITEDGLRGSNLKLLPENTVTIVVRGMILAHTFPVSVLRVPATVNQDLKALLPKVDIEPGFLAACLRSQSSHVLSQVSTSAHGTRRLDAEGLSRIGLILPDIELQRKFTERMAMLDAQRTIYESHLVGLNTLFASLQHQAFSAEL